MTTAQFLKRTSYALRGTDDDIPELASDDGTYWIETLNRIKDQFYRDVTKRWSDSYQVYSVGTVTVNTALTFNLGAEVIAVASKPYVITTDNQRVYLDLVSPEEANENQSVYIAGNNPQVLRFTAPVTSDSLIVGGTLYLPAYLMPADVDVSSTSLPFPDPNYGVMAVASEVAFNDIVYEEKASDLNAKANALFQNMVAKEQRGVYGEPRKIPRQMKRIGRVTR